jgi:hypothetical protein
MESRYNYDIIRDYLHGLVDRKTALEIGELIRTDEIARDIAEGILLLDKEFNERELDVESYLETFRQAQLRKINTPTTLIRDHKQKFPWLQVAAVVILLIVAGVFAIQWMTDKPDLVTLIDQDLSQPYPVSNVFRGPSTEGDYYRAVQLYQNKNYVQASQYFEKAAQTETDLATITFYNGLSSLYSGHYSSAIKLLAGKTVSASRYSQQAQWYLALAYIKSDQTKKGMEILKRIVSSSTHYKRDEAVEFLEAAGQ